jgi:hypothetical protein
VLAYVELHEYESTAPQGNISNVVHTFVFFTDEIKALEKRDQKRRVKKMEKITAGDQVKKK